MSNSLSRTVSSRSNRYCMCGENKTLPFKTLFFDVLTYPVEIKIHIGFKNDLQTERQYSENPHFL